MPPARHFFPLAESLRARGRAHLTEVLLAAVHLFSSARLALARHVVAWLKQTAASPTGL